VLLPILLMLFGLEARVAFGVTGVVAVAACGLVPWYALSASGLTGLDDQVVSGTRLARKRVLPTITAAYQTMTWTTVALAVPTATAATVLLQTSNGWAIGLGAVIVLVTALRTRAYPLAWQVIALWGAVLIPLLVGLVAQFATQPAVGAAIATGIAAAAAILAGARPARHHRARLRRAGNLIEGFAVVALLPLLLGVFNVYADLLGTF
jgi:ESX secretion system protein EccD